MKRYSLTTKANSRRIFRNKHVLGFIVFCIAVLIVLFVAPAVIRTVASVAIVPFVSTHHWLVESSAAFPTYIRSRSELLEEERVLRRALADHAAAALTAERLERENTTLRSLLGATSTDRIAAGVIGRPTALPYDVLLIDRGTEDGIRDHTPVFAGGDQAIGFVSHAFAHSSIVTLVTTPDLTSTVYIYGPNIYTTAVGRGSGSLQVAVPQGIPLSEGDIVVMPSLYGGVYGAISVVDSEPSRPEQYGYVSIDAPLASIAYVSVGTEPITSITFEEAKEIVDLVRDDMLTVPVPQGILVDTEFSTTTATTTATSSLETEALP